MYIRRSTQCYQKRHENEKDWEGEFKDKIIAMLQESYPDITTSDIEVKYLDHDGPNTAPMTLRSTSPAPSTSTLQSGQTTLTAWSTFQQYVAACLGIKPPRAADEYILRTPRYQNEA